MEPQRAKDEGDFNFLFTLEYLKTFIANPRYSTIALIRQSSLTPSRIAGIKNIEDLLTVQGVSQLQRIVARDLAFHEFMRRIGDKYEEYAIQKNGDLDQFVEAGHILASLREKVCQKD